MKTIRNPFIIGSYAGPDYFCDRKDECATLYKHITNNRNVLIMADRRIGKTGLIEHTFSSTNIAKDYYTFFIDIYALHSLNEMVYELAKTVFNTLAHREKTWIERFSSFVKSITTSFTVDSFTGTPSINLSLGEIESPDVTLDEILECLENADKPCVVAIDEFQQISTFNQDNMEALLRTKIQRLKNVSFIFAGSQKHILANMFNSPNRPFYNSVVMMQLLPIVEDTYVDFAINLFSLFGKTLQEDLVRHTYRHFAGITWYVQLFMNEAFAITENGKTADDDIFNDIFENIIATRNFTYEDAYSHLTDKQKMALLAFAKEYPNPITPTSSSFIKKYHLASSSAVQTAVKGLKEKGILSNSDYDLAFSDLLFVQWLKNR